MWADGPELSYTSANQVSVSDIWNVRVTTGGDGSKPLQSDSWFAVAKEAAADEVRSTPLITNGVLE